MIEPRGLSREDAANYCGSSPMRKRDMQPRYYYPGDASRGFVYFIESGGFFKIGYSRDWVRRMSSLKTANPRPITILLIICGSREMEGDLHARFQQFRVSGEWYHPVKEIMDCIDDLTFDAQIELERRR